MTTESFLNAAAKALVLDDDADDLAAQLFGLISVARKGVPVRLTGRPSIMNVLLDLAVADEDGFAAVVDDINEQRAANGLRPLAGTATDRTRYMRELMHERRQRQRRLSKAWNSVLPDSEQVKGQARIEFEAAHAVRWGDEKRAREDALRQQVGRRINIAEKRAIDAQLWRDVDAELDAFEAHVAKLLTKPATQRNIHDYVFTLGRTNPKEKS